MSVIYSEKTSIILISIILITIYIIFALYIQNYITLSL